jgi:hypothetical protein
MMSPTRFASFALVRWSALLWAWCALGPLAGSSQAQTTAGASAPQFTLKNVQTAIQRGVAAIYRDEPNYTFDMDLEGYFDSHNERQVHPEGLHAAAAWALLAAGESYQDPRLYRRINWILAADQQHIYDRSMRLQMLGQLSYNRWSDYLRRDALWLGKAMTKNGGFPNTFTDGSKQPEWSDNANSFYGVLGVWGVQAAGRAIPQDIWRKIDARWRAVQQKTEGDQPAGWAVAPLNTPEAAASKLPFFNRVSAPMTAAGVFTLMTTERYLDANRLADTKTTLSPELTKGIAWLDKNFDLKTADESADWFYYMWTMQRVGSATGLASFNHIDWFRQVSTEMLRRQLADGSWSDTRADRLACTAFAILYLSRAFDPVAVAKLHLPNNSWNNYPHDLWNFADYASDRYEVNTTWQIIELNQPLPELLEAPILYISTDAAYSFDDKQIAKLRDYIANGGLILTNPDGNSSDAIRSSRELAAKLRPDLKLEPLPTTHPLYTIHDELPGGVALLALSNGIRPLMIHLSRDIGPDLQRNEPARSTAFSTLSNLYLYVAGLDTRRVRLASHFTTRNPAILPTRAVAAVRLQHNGEFDPEPAALEQLTNLLLNNQRIELKTRTASAAQLTASDKFAFLTTTGGDTKLADADLTALRDWVKAGGTLWLDAAGGSQTAAANAYDLFQKIFPGEVALPIAPDSPILTGRTAATPANPAGALIPGAYDLSRIRYRIFTLRALGALTEAKLQALDLNGRPAVFFSTLDLTAGLAGLEHWGIFGYSVDSARQLVINSILTAK